MSLLSTFVFLTAVYVLKRWLSKLWHNNLWNRLIIYGTGNLPSSRRGHAVLFTLALFRTVNLAVGGGDAGFIFRLLQVKLADPMGPFRVGLPNNEPYCVNEVLSWPSVATSRSFNVADIC